MLRGGIKFLSAQKNGTTQIISENELSNLSSVLSPEVTSLKIKVL